MIHSTFNWGVAISSSSTATTISAKAESKSTSETNGTTHPTKGILGPWKRHARLIVLLAIFAPLAFFGGNRIRFNWKMDVARKAVNNFEDPLALELLRKIEQQYGKQGEIEFLRSRAYRHLSKFERSEQHLELARQLHFSPSQIEREELLVRAQQGYLEDAEENFQQLLENAGSDFGEVCGALTYGYLIRMRLQEALGMILLWKKEEPKSPFPNYFLALMAQYRRDWPAADQFLDESLSLRGNFLPSIHAKAINKQKQNQFDQAIPFYEQYLSILPDDKEAKRGYADCLFGVGKTETALNQLRSLVEDGDRSFETRLLLGKSELELGNAQACVDVLAPLSQIWPDDVDLNFTLSRAYSQLGQEERAKFHAANTEVARNRLENIDIKIGQAESAHDQPAMRAEVGHILLHYSSREEGRYWLQMALMQDPTIVEAHKDLELYFTRIGDPATAMYHKNILQRLMGLDGAQVPTTSGAQPPTSTSN